MPSIKHVYKYSKVTMAPGVTRHPRTPRTPRSLVVSSSQCLISINNLLYTQYYSILIDEIISLNKKNNNIYI